MGVLLAKIEEVSADSTLTPTARDELTADG
jgi:hypothetical protein